MIMDVPMYSPDHLALSLIGAPTFKVSSEVLDCQGDGTQVVGSQ